MKRGRTWWTVAILLLIAWVPPFLPDAFDYIFRIPPSDGAGMAFVFGYIIFLSYPLTAVALLLTLYKATRAALRFLHHSPKASGR